MEAKRHPLDGENPCHVLRQHVPHRWQIDHLFQRGNNGFFFFFANWSLKGRKLRYSTKEFCLRHFCRSKFSWDPSSSIRTTMKILRAPGSMDMCRQLDKSPYPSSVTRNLISPSVLGTRWMTTTSWYVAFHVKSILFLLLKLILL